ncbi:hypothetical protein M5D96_008135, partial [Drosophila gunungcola]
MYEYILASHHRSKKNSRMKSENMLTGWEREVPEIYDDFLTCACNRSSFYSIHCWIFIVPDTHRNTPWTQWYSGKVTHPPKTTKHTQVTVGLVDRVGVGGLFPRRTLIPGPRAGNSSNMCGTYVSASWAGNQEIPSATCHFPPHRKVSFFRFPEIRFATFCSPRTCCLRKFRQMFRDVCFSQRIFLLPKDLRTNHRPGARLSSSFSEGRCKRR